MVTGKTEQYGGWQQAAELNHAWRDRYPNLGLVDRMMGSNRLPHLSAQEVRETEQEQNFEGTLLYNFWHHAQELTDVTVFLYSFCLAEGIMPDYQEAWSRANGQGTKSPIYDQLYDKALNLNVGNVKANVTDFLKYVMSLSQHLPESMSIVEGMQSVITKNSANRPVEYYGVNDQEGRRLSDDQIIAKYQHTEAILRLLRNHYGSPLQAWMHQPFKNLILDFTQSEKNLSLAHEQLATQDRVMATQMYLALREVTAPTIPQPQMEKKLLRAGAVPLTSSDMLTVSAG